MSAFEKTRYIFNQSIWECNGHFDHWFSNIKSLLCGDWNLRKEKLYPDDFSMNTTSNSSVKRRVVKASMSIYLLLSFCVVWLYLKEFYTLHLCVRNLDFCNFFILKVCVK